MRPELAGPKQQQGIAASTLLTRVQDACLRHRDQRALIWGQNSMTYRDLAESIEGTAASLSDAGIKPGDVVGLVLPRTPALPVAILALWTLGAAYVPFDEELPLERVVASLRGAGVAGLVRQAEPAVDGSVVFEFEQWDNGSGNCRDVAYLIYTSGSSGVPKLVEVGRNALDEFAAAVIETLELTEHDIVLASTSVSFDISVLELVVPFGVGATVLLADRDLVREPERFAELLDDARPTVVQATPSTWRLWAEPDWKAPIKAICGGERLSSELARRLSDRVARLWNAYGPTEATIWVSMFEVVGEVEDNVPVAPVCLGDSRIHLLDEAGQDVPVGQVGEIYLSGAQLANGYYGDREKTAEKFVEIRSGTDTVRGYRTGDLARQLERGEIVFVGRNDSQVKYLGHRIELGDVDAALQSARGVRSAGARLHVRENGEEVLVGYVELLPGEVLDLAALRKACAARLPRVAIPALVLELSAMPYTRNQKLDRNALTPPEPALSPVKSENSAAPAHSLQRICDIFAQVIDLPQIDPHDDFFAVGGHSVVAVRALAQIRREFGSAPTIRQFFDRPTPAGCADLLETQK